MCSDAINFQTESKHFLLDEIKGQLDRVVRGRNGELNSLPVTNQILSRKKKLKQILPLYIIPLIGTITLEKLQNNEYIFLLQEKSLQLTIATKVEMVIS